MNFFDQIYWDNSIRTYCLVFGTILIILLVRKFVSKYIASLILGISNRIWKDIDKKNFTNLILEPLEKFLLILISVFALNELNFPSQINYKIYGNPLQVILDKIGIAAIIFTFIWALLRSIDFIADALSKKPRYTSDKNSGQLVVFFRDFFKVIIGIIGVLFIIKFCFNQSIGNLFTGLSIVGAALALAARESLENLIASFIIFFDKPFTTGDSLKVNAVSGTVEKIGLRSTRIRTAEKTLVTVPNKQMVDSVVDNLSIRSHSRAEIKLELSVATSTAKIKEFIIQAKNLLHSEKLITSSSVFLREINKNGALVVIEYFTEPNINNFDVLKEEINIAVKQLLENSTLSFAATGTNNNPVPENI